MTKEGMPAPGRQGTPCPCCPDSFFQHYSYTIDLFCFTVRPSVNYNNNIWVIAPPASRLLRPLWLPPKLSRLYIYMRRLKEYILSDVSRSHIINFNPSLRSIQAYRCPFLYSTYLLLGQRIRIKAIKTLGSSMKMNLVRFEMNTGQQSNIDT